MNTTISTIKLQFDHDELNAALVTTLEAFVNHGNTPSQEERNAAKELIALQKKVQAAECFIESEHLKRILKAVITGIRFFTLTRDALFDDPERGAIYELSCLADQLADHC